MDEESEKFSNSKSLVSVSCIAFAYFFANFNLTLLMIVLLIKKCIIAFIPKTMHHCQGTQSIDVFHGSENISYLSPKI